jgi:transcriptional regulator with PAS, ATPase and Fis domain
MIENFIKECDFGLTICDKEGIITYMNDKAKNIFKNYGDNLIGQSLFDCHPEPAKSKLKDMILKEKKNVYSIEKNGVKKLIYQMPFYEDKVYAGFYELSLEIPLEMKHFKRD